MIKLKNILNENEEYQSLGQKGEIPMLDPDADMEHSDSVLSRLEQVYMKIKPKRIDASEFKNDVRDLISIYKDKSDNDRNQYFSAFFDLYPYSKTNSTYKSAVTDIMNSLNGLLKHAADMEKGDTSSYGYRVHPWQKEKGIR